MRRHWVTRSVKLFDQERPLEGSRTPQTKRPEMCHQARRQPRNPRQSLRDWPDDLVIQIAAGGRRGGSVPDIMLLARDQLLRCPTRHRAHRDVHAAWLDHPHRELVVELIDCKNRLIRAQSRLNGSEADAANLLDSLTERARAASANANARS